MSNNNGHKHVGNSRLVQNHYNGRPELGIQNRQQSLIVHLKNFNNWIKATLIQKFTHRNDHVLDLCCGKGGDLLKWKNAHIDYLMACDIADLSVQQAKTRYLSAKTTFKADFHAVDCFSDDLMQFTRRQTFDVINCQFALHYAFETEAKAHTAIKNISRHLVPGGHFIGTIPNSNWIVKKLRASPGLTFGNPIYSFTVLLS